MVRKYRLDVELGRLVVAGKGERREAEDDSGDMVEVPPISVFSNRAPPRSDTIEEEALLSELNPPNAEFAKDR